MKAVRKLKHARGVSFSLRVFVAVCLLAGGFAEANYPPGEQSGGAPVLLQAQACSLGPASSVQIHRVQPFDSSHSRNAALVNSLRLPAPGWRAFDPLGSRRMVAGTHRSSPGRQRAPPEIS